MDNPHTPFRWLTTYSCENVSGIAFLIRDQRKLHQQSFFDMFFAALNRFLSKAHTYNMRQKNTILQKTSPARWIEI